MITRKKFSWLAVLMVAIFALAACGNKKEEEKSSTDKVEMVDYKAKNGTISIPKNPKRVVITADSFAGYALQLGIKPVGLSSFALSNKYFGERIEGIEDIGAEESPEKIMSLKPDLIITFAQSENLDKLEKIAPTVAIIPKEKSFKEEMTEFGTIFNKEAEAAQWISEWDKKVAKYKPQVQKAVGDQTISILGVGDKEAYAYGNNFGRGGEIIYGEFDLEMPKLVKKQTPKGTGYASFSVEKLPDFAGDYLFVESGGDTYSKTKETGLWKSLPAVKNNKVFEIDSTDAFFSDPISLDQQIEEIVGNLTK
ncbi:ABC transporter substrate-binding protein [Kurthia zopfii]|uniref:ABC transporter substrate-binding protein n=1 Tax=Kurthia zopfii TaxID=1650 RepID=UPI000F6DA232|nr:ABC transporter substrate-binding protein [Kurthia zopfii]VEI06090.1 Iron(III)-hydroxamate-binding protein fhuD [Kurthia zopfii]